MLCSNAFSGVVCTGKVTTLALGPRSGVLQVNNGYGVHYLCMFDQTYNCVKPDTCKVWYSMFLTAKVTGKNISQYYPNGAVCENLGSWTVPLYFQYFVTLDD